MFVYEQRYGHFYAEITEKMFKKLLGYFFSKRKYKIKSKQKYVHSLIFQLLLILLKCIVLQKISCAHACADIIYSLNAGKNG